MNYITFAFVIFTAVTVLLYYLWPWKKYQWCVLLAASYVFYCSSSVRMAVWMVITSIVIYLCALRMEKLGDAEAAALHRKKPDGTALLRPEKKALKAAFKRKRKALLTFGLLIIFGILAFFKYIPGLISGISGGRFTMNLLLPIGISFYTFQSAGYLIDVYNGQSRAEKNFFKIALFVSFFPQIVQGPISFYDQLGQQLYEEHKPDWRGFKYGLSLILFGYLEKMVLADRIVGYIYQVSDNYTQYSGTLTGLAILLYALQLYADFAGGINISIGIAQLFGISLQQNFRQPYFSASINDYWRRWHITLGAWMKKIDGAAEEARKVRLRQNRIRQTSCHGAAGESVVPCCFPRRRYLARRRHEICGIRTLEWYYNHDLHDFRAGLQGVEQKAFYQ